LFANAIKRVGEISTIMGVFTVITTNKCLNLSLIGTKPTTSLNNGF